MGLRQGAEPTRSCPPEDERPWIAHVRITSTIVADGEHAQRRVPARRSARALLPALQNSRLHVAALGEPLGRFASSQPESEFGTLRFLEGDVLDAVHDLGLKG